MINYLFLGGYNHLRSPACPQQQTGTGGDDLHRDDGSPPPPPGPPTSFIHLQRSPAYQLKEGVYLYTIYIQSTVTFIQYYIRLDNYCLFRMNHLFCYFFQ